MTEYQEAAGGEEDGAVEDAAEGGVSRRAALVRRAVDAWKKQLIDLGGRNNLLYYRDLKVGTLDFADCSRRALEALVEGKAVPLSRLFPDEEAHADAVRRARAIHKKALEHFEERGIETLFLGYGMATWSGSGLARTAPRAPALLRPAHLLPRGAAHDEFELVLTGEMELSSTLLHVLATEFRCMPDQSTLELDGLIDTLWELEEAVQWLKREAATIPGFAIEGRTVLGTFSYMKLPMVRDLEENFELLESHDFVAAVAGDQGAREALREQYAAVTVALDDPNHTPPADEFLVLDADSSQNWAINAAIRGQDLIVRGPPGTGKSQTIANLIASAVARGQRILFVAEKRAAIDAVVKRLTKVGLADIVFDLHGGVAGRRQLAQTLAQSIDATSAIPLADRSVEFAKLEKRRDDLNGHAEAFHQSREPWGVSVYEAEVEIIGTPEAARTEVRFDGDLLAALDRETINESEEDLHDFASLGGFSLRDSGSAWARAKVTSQEGAREALAAARDLRARTLPNAAGALGEAAREVGVRLGETPFGRD